MVRLNSSRLCPETADFDHIGGPGGGVGEKDRRYFDPKAYKIVSHSQPLHEQCTDTDNTYQVLFDQRGAGKSTPLVVEMLTSWQNSDGSFPGAHHWKKTPRGTLSPISKSSENI